MRDLPGPGDEVIWGPITHPNDPRRDEVTEDALGKAVDDLLYDPKKLRELIRTLDSDELWLRFGEALSQGEIQYLHDWLHQQATDIVKGG